MEIRCTDSCDDFIWIKWVHEKYIRDGYWIDFDAKTNVNWSVKKLCNIKLQDLNMEHELLKPSYSVNRMFDLMHSKRAQQGCAKAVWSRLSVPKHRIIFWGLVTDASCPICHASIGSVHHFSSNVLCGEAAGSDEMRNGGLNLQIV